VSFRYLRVFWERAYRENITGLAAMVAYNLALALFPFVLLVLFIFGQVIDNADVRQTVIHDLQQIFPSAEQDSLAGVVDRIRDSSATIGVVAAIATIWIGASFWGAMDTAFCRIYHVECRGWVEQKRWALLMLFVIILFLPASVLVPVAEGLLASGAADLPFGLDNVGALRTLGVLFAALMLTFAGCSLIYYVVPKGRLHPHRPDLVLLRQPHADGGGGDQRPALRAPRHRQRRGGKGTRLRRDGIARVSRSGRR